MSGTLVMSDLLNSYRKPHYLELHIDTHTLLVDTCGFTDSFSNKKFIYKNHQYNSKQIQIMKQLSKEQYDVLKKYEKHLRRGHYGNYTYGLFQKDFDELLKIYKELGGNERIQYNCNVCVLRLTKSLGKLYFEYKPVEEHKVTEVTKTTEDEVEDKPETKKKGRKKKESQ